MAEQVCPTCGRCPTCGQPSDVYATVWPNESGPTTFSGEYLPPLPATTIAGDTQTWEKVAVTHLYRPEDEGHLWSYTQAVDS